MANPGAGRQWRSTGSSAEAPNELSSDRARWRNERRQGFRHERENAKNAGRSLWNARNQFSKLTNFVRRRFRDGGLNLVKAVRWEHDYVRIESRAEFRLGLFCHGTGHQLATPG